MVTIGKIVREALTENLLTVVQEEQLRECLSSKQYTSDDLRAFFTLQKMVMSGIVKQESRSKKI
ncbi:MAG: hypothetical protein F6K31_24780 [Symploca sp. SIO2G7]|nr:hypothetical protein [Symploca sp. SIO2G7]